MTTGFETTAISGLPEREAVPANDANGSATTEPTVSAGREQIWSSAAAAGEPTVADGGECDGVLA